MGFVTHLRDKGFDMRRSETQLRAAQAQRSAAALGAPSATAGEDAEAAAARERVAARIGVLAWGRVPLELPGLTVDIQRQWAQPRSSQITQIASLPPGLRVATGGSGDGGGMMGALAAAAAAAVAKPARVPVLFPAVAWWEQAAFADALGEDVLTYTHTEARERLMQAFKGLPDYPFAPPATAAAFTAAEAGQGEPAAAEAAEQAAVEGYAQAAALEDAAAAERACGRAPAEEQALPVCAAPAVAPLLLEYKPASARGGGGGTHDAAQGMQMDGDDQLAEQAKSADGSPAAAAAAAAADDDDQEVPDGSSRAWQQWDEQQHPVTHAAAEPEAAAQATQEGASSKPAANQSDGGGSPGGPCTPSVVACKAVGRSVQSPLTTGDDEDAAATAAAATAATAATVTAAAAAIAPPAAAAAAAAEAEPPVAAAEASAAAETLLSPEPAAVAANPQEAQQPARVVGERMNPAADQPLPFELPFHLLAAVSPADAASQAAPELRVQLAAPPAVEVHQQAVDALPPSPAAGKQSTNSPQPETPDAVPAAPPARVGDHSSPAGADAAAAAPAPAPATDPAPTTQPAPAPDQAAAPAGEQAPPAPPVAAAPAAQEDPHDDSLSPHASAATPEEPGLWWPCEVIDPWAPPDGFQLRLQHLLALAPADRAASVPPRDLKRLLSVLQFHPALAVEEAAAKDKGAGGRAAAAAAAASGRNGGGGGDRGDGAAASREDAAGVMPAGTARADGQAATGGEGGEAASDPDAAPAAAIGRRQPDEPTGVAGVIAAALAAARAASEAVEPRAPHPASRLLLVTWFGSGSFEWRAGKELLPFRPYKRYMDGEGLCVCGGLVWDWV